MNTFKKLPGVSAFKRTSVISDASMFNLVDGVKADPVLVIRHGIMGTKNVLKSDEAGENSHTVNSDEVRNLQVTDSAKLSPSANGMHIEFTLSLLDLSHSLHSVAAGKKDDASLISEYRDSVYGFVARAKESSGLAEVANRTARNILNGRWLWRNRLIAKAINIAVECDQQSLAQADALSLPLDHFDDYSDQELALGKELTSQMKGEKLSTLKVMATVYTRAQGVVEVYPSQNYLEKKKAENKKTENKKTESGVSRSLYVHHAPDLMRNMHSPSITGYAAIRDQKVGNALRTIDTWYPSDSKQPKPIPVEPMGANLEEQRFFRQKKSSSFELLKSLNELDPNSPDGMFVIACLIRGGVYSVGDK